VSFDPTTSFGFIKCGRTSDSFDDMPAQCPDAVPEHVIAAVRVTHWCFVCLTGIGAWSKRWDTLAPAPHRRGADERQTVADRICPSTGRWARATVFPLAHQACRSSKLPEWIVATLVNSWTMGFDGARPPDAVHS
jgi:hypothetical protein